MNVAGQYRVPAYGARSPCDGCEHYAFCRRARAACTAFVKFVKQGGAPQRYRTDLPTQRLFAQVYL